MKCPHCGMNIRDNITECGYCGGAVSPQPESAHAGGLVAGKAPVPDFAGAEPDTDEEEEGGLAKILQPGEQVLIGALNVTVKKFFFHAYLTNQRIFLIDTQEKKLRVTAKDIPRQTIAGSSVESSESADPVLVLSLKSADEEVKTLKLVFVQSDTDRSAEIDEWVALLNDGHPKKKSPRRQAEAPEPEVKPEAAKPARPAMERPVQRQQELHPARKPPAKQLEKQAPVKRLLSMYNVPEEEPEKAPVEPEPPVVQPRRAQVRQVQEREIVRDEPAETPAPVPKPEVQSAMKVAMKSAMRPLQQPHTRPVKRTISSEPVQDQPPAPPRRPVVQEPVRQKPVVEEEIATATPQFCHNCGKKLPPSANFCPGCGTKLSQSRTLPQNRPAATVPDRRMTRTDPPHQDARPPRVEEPDDEDEGGETPVVAKPPIKKAPKGSEMTILHKFLRR